MRASSMIALMAVYVSFASEGALCGELQRRIDEAAAAGGGRVVVKAGIHHTGTLRLKSHVELHLEEGAVLLASTNIADYAEFPREVCPVAPGCMYWTLIMAWDAEDIAITGKGVIDGQGPAFFDRKPPRGHWPKPKARPRMVQFVRCKGVRLEGVTFKDSPQWTMFIRLCDDISIDGIRIVADQRMINNDGIDFDGCRRVRVGNSLFKTGDDCIILRAMRERQDEHIVCEDIVVSNCVLNSTCQSIRMGAPSDDTIRNALFKNIKIGGFNGIFFDYPARYVRPYDDGYMDISGIVFDGFEGCSYGSAVQIVAEPGIKIRGVRDVTFRNFNVRSAKPLRFVGNADSVLSNIALENFTATVKGGKPYQAVATEPLTFRNCTFNGKKVPDEKLVTPRGKRKPLNRSNRSSWETANQSPPQDGPGTYFEPRKGTANVTAAVVERPGAIRKTVAFLGGSITEMNGFRPRVMKALREKYPQVDFFEIAAGLFLTAGPDAGDIEVSVDGGPFRKESLRAKYGSLHYPYVHVLADDLVDDAHTVRLRVVHAKRRKGTTGTAVRIHRICVN